MRQIVHLFRTYPALSEAVRKMTADGFFSEYNAAMAHGLDQEGNKHLFRRVDSEDDALSVAGLRPEAIVVHGGTSEHTGKALYYLRCDRSKVTILP